MLEPHPHIPVLATSGLDDDVKIWVPTCEEDPDLPNLDQVGYCLYLHASVCSKSVTISTSVSMNKLLSVSMDECVQVLVLV